MLYEGFVTLVPDEQAVQELLSYFPAREVEEPVTKDFLRAEMADLRTESANLRTELHTEMSELRSELRGEMSELRSDLRGEMAGLRTELRGEMADLRTEMERMVRSFQAWTVGAVASVGSLVVLAEKLLE